MKDGSGTLADKLCADGVFTDAEGRAAGVLGGGAGWTYEYAAYDDSTIVYEKKTAAGVTANVLTVNVRNPRVSVKSAMVDNTLGRTAPFSQIVQGSGAAAVINGNFCASYSAFKTTIGHVMVNGQFLYGNSGVSSLGITRDGEIRVGRPALFTRIQPTGGSTSWTAYEINTAGQDAYSCVLYTPAYGSTVPIKADGSLLTVSGGVITGFAPAAAGSCLVLGSAVAFALDLSPPRYALCGGGVIPGAITTTALLFILSSIFTADYSDAADITVEAVTDI